MNDKPKNFVDYTGFVSGKATVISFDSWHIQPSGQRKSKWLCQCSCGNTFVAMGTNLRKPNHTTSCGCEKKANIKKYREKVSSGEWVPEKLKGTKFGRLTVVNFTSWHKTAEGQRNSMWDCLCDCGNSIEMRRSYLQATEVPSCGCYKSEKLAEARTTHGMTGTPTYCTWSKMKERCYLESYKEKEVYQDRGITVCDRWLESFENFYEDMGERPEDMTLDRINPEGNYNKHNCRWADLTTQSYNRRMNTNNSSGRTGVFQLANGLWQAIISHYKERIILAYNVSYEEACVSRAAGELEYYGWNKE